MMPDNQLLYILFVFAAFLFGRLFQYKRNSRAISNAVAQRDAEVLALLKARADTKERDQIYAQAMRRGTRKFNQFKAVETPIIVKNGGQS